MKRIGVVGPGAIASVHLDGWTRMPGVEVVGYYDIVPAAAQRAVDRYGGKAFASLDALCAAVDVIDICSPGTAHKENVLAVAAAGVPMICEKPLARHLRDAEEMVEACDRAGVPLFPAQVVRFFPEFARVHSAVASGAIGRPGVYRSVRNGSFPRPGNSFSSQYYADYTQSGGVILDVAVHDIDFARWCCGDVERVFTRGLTFAGKPYVDHALIVLRFTSGALGHIEVSWAYPRGMFRTRVEVTGDGGLVEWDSLDRPPLLAFLHNEAGDGHQQVGLSPVASVDEPYYAELAHFIDCLDGKVEPRVTAHDGLMAVKIGLAAIRSLETGLPVTIAEFQE